MVWEGDGAVGIAHLTEVFVKAHMKFHRGDAEVAENGAEETPGSCGSEGWFRSFQYP